MKRLLSFFAVVLLFGMVGAPKTHAQASISFQVFYDTLAPYGDWVEVEDYGYCWQPRVESGWRPYTNGAWSYTSAGWTWMANEPWGWAPYHYGRWTMLRGRGWVWVPGYEWGPAWVSWRFGGNYVGWAPLPPRAIWRPATGFGVSVDYSYDIGPSYYNFCQVGAFGSRYLRPAIISPRQNVTIINNTVNVTNISVRNTNIYNAGPDYNYINTRSTHKVPRYQLDRRTHFDPERVRNGYGLHRSGNRLEVMAPRVTRGLPSERPPRVSYRANRDQINRGWDNIPNREEAVRLRERNRRQAESSNLTGTRPRPQGEDRRGEALRQQREQSQQRIEARQRDLQRQQREQSQQRLEARQRDIQRQQQEERRRPPQSADSFRPPNRDQRVTTRPPSERPERNADNVRRALPVGGDGQVGRPLPQNPSQQQQRFMQQQRDRQQRQQIQQHNQSPAFPRPQNRESPERQQQAQRQQQLQRQQQQQNMERQYQQQRQMRQSQQQREASAQSERRRDQERQQRSEMRQRMNTQSGSQMQQQMRQQQQQQQQMQRQQRQQMRQMQQGQNQQTDQFQQRRQQHQMRMNRAQPQQP